MSKLTPNQAHYVLSALVAEGRIRQSHIDRALKSRVKEIRNLRERLAALEALAEQSAKGGARARRARGGRKAARVKVRRRRAMSPRVRALRRQQGRYMGYVRRLKAADKARVRAVREKQGIGAAIKMASSLGGKS